MARRTLPRRHRRTRTRRTGPQADRTPSRRGSPAARKDDTFDFETVPMLSKAQVMAITAGDSWLAKGANLLLFGPPGGGKSHLAAAIGLALIDNGARVLFTRTTDLVQKLQVARRELALEAAINRLDRFDLLILDDSARIRPRPACCSSSSVPATNAAPSSSPQTSRSVSGARSSP